VRKAISATPESDWHLQGFHLICSHDPFDDFSFNAAIISFRREIIESHPQPKGLVLQKKQVY